MSKLNMSAVFDIRKIIKYFKNNAPQIIELQKNINNLSLGERESIVIKLYLESKMDEVDIAEKLDITTVEVVRVLQANRIY